MPEKAEVAVVGIDIGKKSFHVVVLSDRGEIVLRQKWSRSQIGVRLGVVGASFRAAAVHERRHEAKGRHSAMKFGFRTPSLEGRLSARLSPARALRHRAGLKLPRGAGWLSGPERARRNRIHQRTTVDPLNKDGVWLLIVLAVVAAMVVAHLFGESRVGKVAKSPQTHPRDPSLSYVISYSVRLCGNTIAARYCARMSARLGGRPWLNTM